MMPIPVGQDPPPQYVWMPPAVVSSIRRTCTGVGVVLLVAGAVLGLLLGILAFRLPTSSFVGNTITALMSVLAAAFVLILGFAVVGSRRYVGDQHLDVAGAAPLRRIFVVLAVAVCATAGFAFLVVLGTTDDAGPGVLAYLGLLTACPVLAVAGAAVALSRLRPHR